MKGQKKAARRQLGVVAARSARPVSTRWWWYAAGIFALAYAGFQAYGSVLNGPFVFDDSYLPFRVPHYPTELRFWVFSIRPLLMLTYWINFQISGTDTLWYHICNVLFHIANSFLVFLIVRKMLSYPQARPAARDDARDDARDGARSGGGDQLSLLLSAFAAGLFLLHPVQTEGVAYVASRSENFSLLFLLAAFTLFLYRRREEVSWTVTAGVLLLYGAAISVKEHTVALIGVLLLTDYYWNPGFSFAGIRRNWRLYGPVILGAGAGIVMVLRMLARDTSAGFRLKDFTWYQYFFTQCRAFFVYLRLVFFPLNQSADYAYPISRTIFDGGAIYGLIGILLLAALAIRYRKQYRLASYGFFVYLALLAPTSSFIPIQDTLAERRLYLPIIGMLFIITDVLQRVPLQRKALASAMAGVLIIAGALTYERNRVWTSDLALWLDTVEKSPDNPRAHFHLAYAYQYDAGRCDLALPEYAAVDRIGGPAYARRYELLVDWGEAYDCANQGDQALQKLRQAAAMEPNAHVFTEIGMMAAKRARYGEALDALATAEKLDANYVMTYVNRGKVYQAMNQLAAAVENYRRALALEPANELARAGLAEVQQLLTRQRTR